MISEKQKNIIIQTLKPFNPVKIGIFGSMARNEESFKSDIDILYHFKDTIGLFRLIALKQELEKKLNKKVDLVAEKYLNTKIKSNVLKDVKIIYFGE